MITDTLIHGFQTSALGLSLCVLSLVGMIFACRAAVLLWGILRGHFRGLHIAAFAIMAGVSTIYARKGLVTYPRTDPTISYLTDRGSYITNDLVHIDFQRIIAPDTAMFYIDYRTADSTNDEDWATFYTGTFAEWLPPIEFEFDNATNFDFMVYTDWTPGPSVQTNGVWHAFWGMDQRERRFFVPVRTSLRLDGDVIATPKSKEDSANENP